MLAHFASSVACPCACLLAVPEGEGLFVAVDAGRVADVSPDFADAQYRALAPLLRGLGLRSVAAHSEIAPGRKTDPGARFDWARLLLDLASLR